MNVLSDFYRKECLAFQQISALYNIQKQIQDHKIIGPQQGWEDVEKTLIPDSIYKGNYFCNKYVNHD